MSDLSIGAAARASGVKVTTIRFYEGSGLLPAPPRTRGNRRLYAARDVERLRFIRHARDLGFDLDAVRDLLAMSDHPDRDCASVDAVARVQLAEVDRRLAQLTALRQELARIATQCAGGRVADCRVIEALADHAHCATDHRSPDGRSATGGVA